MDSFSATVRGRVQGVSFRYYTQKQAHSLGLKGWVRNDPGGSVSVVATGPRARLIELLEFLHKGPPTATVDNVEVSWSTTEQLFNDFSIRWR